MQIFSVYKKLLIKGNLRFCSTTARQRDRKRRGEGSKPKIGSAEAELRKRRYERA